MKHIYSTGYLSYNILLFSFTFFSSCVSPRAEIESRQAAERQTALELSSVQTKSVSNMQKELMTTHDSLMPAMGKLMHLKRELKNRLQDTKTANERKLNAMRDAVVLLESADSAMMNWMRSYKTDYEGMQEAEIKNYLVKEKEQIDEVKRKMIESMNKAKNILKLH